MSSPEHSGEAGHKLESVKGLTVSEAAQMLGVARSAAHRMIVKSIREAGPN